MGSINEQVIELIQRETSGAPLPNVLDDLIKLINHLLIYRKNLKSHLEEQ